MKIGIPVQQYHPGNTSDYVKTAFDRLGHTSQILNSVQFHESFLNNKFDLYLIVDSGAGFKFNKNLLGNPDFSRLGFWFIDFRHNWKRDSRNPPDLDNAQYIHEHGGWVFQAQVEDYQNCLSLGFTRAKHLMVAADPQIWQNHQVDKIYDIGFVGNVWDEARANILTLILKSQIKLGFYGPGKIWKSNAANFLCQSKIGFNISSFYGSSIAYDLNMRFFEVLSCGLPIITNYVPSLELLDVSPLKFIKTYKKIDEILPLITSALNCEDFLGSGEAARNWILAEHTYEHRMQLVLDTLGSQS